MRKFILYLLFFHQLVFLQTTNQIKMVKEYAKRSGMTKSDIISTAKSQGYTDKEIEDAIAKEKPEENKKSDLKDNMTEISNGEDFIQTNDNQESQESNLEEELLEIDSKEQIVRNELSYFGYDIFNRDPSLFQASAVGAVEPDYLIGPEDEIIVMLWGETQFRQVLTVNREGFIFIPEVGQVFVNGLNLNLLESKLFRVMSQSYASLNPQGRKATTFLDVSLGNLRPLRIQVVGEVAQPGAYTINHSATLFSSLYYFNGPTTLGSLRNISLIRGGKEIGSIDFYDYLLTGKKPNDYKLQLDDIVFIPRRFKTVTIEGEINRPGIYELKSNETLQDIINMSGDLKITAYLDRVQIDRIVPFKERKDLGMDRMVSDIDLKQIVYGDEDLDLQDGDRIQIFSILDSRLNIVEITGAVTRPGSYQLEDSLYLFDLIEKSDGLLGDAYRSRIDVIRVDSKLNQKLIKLNLDKVLIKDPDNNILLNNLDRVTVYSLGDMITKNTVSVNGNVKRPGTYALIDSMTIRDLIFSSGGFVDQEFLQSSYLERADLLRYTDNNINRKILSFNLGELIQNKDFEQNLMLQAGDEIIIYPKTLFENSYSISINGSVINPGIYELKNQMTLKDLLIEAGGFSNDVFRYLVEISRIDPQNTSSHIYSTKRELSINKKYLDMLPVSDDSKGNINPLLEPYDIVFIRPDPYFSMQRKVEVIGNVMYPGEYSILNASETIKDIIERAGGVKESAYLEGSTFIRNGEEIKISLSNVIKKSKSKYNYQVQDNDKIIIVSYPRFFTLSGEINAPGNYPYKPGGRIKSAIKEAGGLSPNADKSNIYIIYPSGISKKYQKFIGNHRIMDGSEIIIGLAPEEEPFDRTEYFKELTNIMASLAQTLSILFIAVNN